MHVIKNAEGHLFTGYKPAPGSSLFEPHFEPMRKLEPVQPFLYPSDESVDEAVRELSRRGYDVVAHALAADCDTVDALHTQVERLEALRPHWAQGHSDDSIAAQHATNALNQLWSLLGAKNQTQAVQELSKLVSTFPHQLPPLAVNLNHLCDCTFPEQSPGVVYWRADDVRKRFEGAIASYLNVERAFNHVYDAYAVPRDKFSNDGEAYVCMRNHVTKAFGFLQRATGRLK